MADTNETASRRMITFVATILVIAIVVALIYFLVLTPGDPTGGTISGGKG